MAARKKRGEAATNGGAASPVPETPETPSVPQSLNQRRKAGVVKRDRRERFN